MRIFNTEIKKAYVSFLGEVYFCYKYAGNKKGNIAYVSTIWEVIEFILM